MKRDYTEFKLKKGVYPKEIANGLLQQYFPKSMKLNNISKKKVFDVVHKLNSRPRKCLGFKTPYEVFEELTGINMNKST